MMDSALIGLAAGSLTALSGLFGYLWGYDRAKKAWRAIGNLEGQTFAIRELSDALCAAIRRGVR